MNTSKNIAKQGASEALELPLILPSEQNSVHHFLQRAAGYQIQNEITLSANNTTASEQVFKVTGTVYIQRLFAIVTEATTLTDCDSASFDLFPAGGAAVQISAATGDIGGVAVGTVIAKTGLAANVFDVADAAGAVITEQGWAGSDIFNAFLVTQKTGIDTFIRFTYTTTDAPIDAKLMVYCEYRPLNGGDLVAV